MAPRREVVHDVGCFLGDAAPDAVAVGDVDRPRVVHVERRDVDVERGEVTGEVTTDEAARAGDDRLHEPAFTRTAS